MIQASRPLVQSREKLSLPAARFPWQGPGQNLTRACAAKAGDAAASTPAPTPVLPLSVVQNPAVKGALPLIGNVAYVALAGGFLMTDVLLLRLLLSFGYGTLVIFHSLQLNPLKIPLAGSVFFVFVNIYFTVNIYLERQVNLSAEERAIHEDFFNEDLAEHEFQHIIRKGEIKTATEKTQVVTKGELQTHLVFVLDGHIDICIGEESHVHVKKEEFVGEGSFIGEIHKARADAFAMPGCRYVIWDLATLKTQLAAEPHAQRALEVKIGRELAHKLHDTSLLLAKANHRDHDHGALVAAATKEHKSEKK